MTAKHENPYAKLERVFHEPNRLAIVSKLAGAVDGMTFTDLRDTCGLTDGNLSRHLKALSDARVVRIRKAFVRNKPQTTVFLSDNGRGSFLKYLGALETVLRDAAAATGKEGRQLRRRLNKPALDGV